MRHFLFISLILVSGLLFSQEKNLQTIIKERKIPKGDLIMKIDKSAYKVYIYHNEEKLITYPRVFGFNAEDDKMQEGDGCTPEGNFGVRSMYAHSSWKYFIWIDYPNEESWSRFKQRKTDRILSNEATVGGEIGIHGMDDMIENKTNWTLGCISLTNADIEDLYK